MIAAWTNLRVRVRDRITVRVSVSVRVRVMAGVRYRLCNTDCTSCSQSASQPAVAGFLHYDPT